MEPTPPKPDNPYAPPATDNVYAAQVAQGAGVNGQFVKQFRREIQALGGFWIFIGLLVSVVGGYLIFLNENALVELNGQPPAELIVLMAVFFGLGALWLVLGVLTCLKHLWAVYVALVLSYISLVGNLIQLNLCGLIILIVVILQAHRVIRWAGQLRAAGVPLTATPKDFPSP